jgi:hypothetical protein
MTISDAIIEISRLKPHQYPDETIVRWLSDLDGRVAQDLLRGSGDEPAGGVLPYKPQDRLTPLLIPFPHEDVYLKWLMAQIDYANADIDRYNNSMVMFQTQYEAFVDAWTREHPKKPVYITGIRGDLA